MASERCACHATCSTSSRRGEGARISKRRIRRYDFTAAWRISNSMTMPFGIGKPVRRKEDLRLLTGRGEFSDDINVPDQAYAVVLRSPHAHAVIRSIDTSAALGSPGVLAVLTGRDYVADGGKPIPTTPNPRDIPLTSRGGQAVAEPPDHPLAVDKVRYAGEGVAMIVAATRAAAQDAAELVRVDYAPLPAVVSVADALKPGAPAVWDQADDNVCCDEGRGNKNAVDAAFARAAHVTRMEIRNNRVTGLPLEPAAALGLYDAAADRYTLRAGGQGIMIQKRALAAALGVDESKVRVICRDVGGGFGTKNLIYREYVLVGWAARRLGRPVKWRGERSEAFFFDPYGRDLTSVAELALDADGKFLAVRTHNIQNLGAQTLHLVPLARGAAVTNGVYAIPAVHARLQAVFTNTAPTSTYRGAGRPEAMFIIERLIDTAAAEMGLDRVKLRRKNFIRPKMLPYVNPMTTRYDSGEFDTNMMRALAMIDLAGFEKRRRGARRRGKRLGLGLANFIETATGIPPERAVVKVLPEGRVTVTIGTQASGQGHETAYAQCIAEWFSVPFDAIELIHGDTEVVLMGSGSHSCRSMRLAGLLMGRARDEILARGKKVAARALQADAGHIEFSDGRFTVAGTGRAIDLFAAARLAEEFA